MLAQSPRTIVGPEPVAQAPDGRLLLSIEDVAELLSVGKRTIDRLIYGGHLGSVKLGGRRLVPWHEVVAYVRRLESGADAMMVAPARSAARR